MRSIYYLKYGHIYCYFHSIYRVLVQNTSFYFNGYIKNMFLRIIIIDKTKIQYTANSVEPIYYTTLHIPIIILYFAA